MNRTPLWESALSDYIALMRHEPFEYGINDCCMFAAGAVKAMTGIDPMAEFRGRYNSLATSVRALREIGDGDLEATMDAKFPEVAPHLAHRGDLAFYDGSVGVVVGSVAYFVTDDGLTRIPRDKWLKCWSVGRG